MSWPDTASGVRRHCHRVSAHTVAAITSPSIPALTALDMPVAMRM